MKNHEMSGVADGSSTPPASRKAYEKPVLQIYGDLAEITQANMLSGSNDGAGHPNKHFTS
jgi:hypothetical protein